ncbi:hypothetical protein GSUB_11550 [Geoalkalibacter subterraneus]|uniref:Uncharacterized protein n=1 Tax=Geoalkalibacter subterraneus TaxID=483547 RepID=A0A0B5FU01_9BACT|nr:hypothetical protein GSUB_11550 [Geoalkalibacter subterraneus]
MVAEAQQLTVGARLAPIKNPRSGQQARDKIKIALIDLQCPGLHWIMTAQAQAQAVIDDSV